MAMENTNTLVTVYNHVVAGIEQQTTDARELHTFLGVPTKFADWITRKISEYGFAENKDYILTVLKTGKRSNVTKTEYKLTLDMAKELAMAEKTDKGREVRRYFIDCEARLKAEMARQLEQLQPLALVDLNLKRFWVTTNSRGETVRNVPLTGACKLVPLVNEFFDDAVLMRREDMLAFMDSAIRTVWEMDKRLQLMFAPMRRVMEGASQPH